MYNYYVAEEKSLVKKIKGTLGFIPTNIQLYKTAFSHKSLNQGINKNGINNERLEYLGDAILSTVVAEYLFRKYPKKKEGFLTKMRSKIVKRNTLNQVAEEMGLDILLSHFINTRISSSMKGNALEALIGAIYVEQGYNRTRQYIIKNIIIKHLDINALEAVEDNHKSQLLEHCQKVGSIVEFRLLKRFKSDNRDRFKIAVCIDGDQHATAEDFNKKSAEQKAAKIAIDKILQQTLSV